MRIYLIAAAVLLIVGCGGAETEDQAAKLASDEGFTVTDETPEPFVPSYSENVWYTSRGWPGEYPPGFSVMDEDVSILARAGMHDTLPRNIECTLPQNATYQLWNDARVESDELEFVTVSEKFDITITERAELDAPTGDFDNPNNTIKLEPGDQITYLRYLGEGWTLMEFNGTERDINEMDLMEISDIQTAGEAVADDILWIKVPCGETQGWLTLTDALSEPGILMSPVIGFGESRDLTEQDRKNALEQAKWSETEATEE